MEAYELLNLLNQRHESGHLYLEFLHHDSMSAGIYVLPTDGIDPQTPHTEDEAYYIISGRGQIRVAGEDRPVQPGTTVFVGKGVEHRFHSIESELTILVFFAPAEYSQQ
jgi:mannose-6-phosphate isomerase-like protein (cupin superfamily)